MNISAMTYICNKERNISLVQYNITSDTNASDNK